MDTNCPKGISIGEALIDRLGPIGSELREGESHIDCFGGAPANVACALARLKLDVAFIGRIGDDKFGNDFESLMLNRGVNISGLQKDLSRPTRVVMVERDQSGERSFGGFVGNEGMGFADEAISHKELLAKWECLS